MPVILLVRHAQASFGEAHYDALSELGARQAAALAEHLTRPGRRVDRVVSGALARQRDTAAPIAAAAGCETIVDARWNEYDADDILAAHSDSAVRLDRPPGSDAPPVSEREFQDTLEVALASWIAAPAAGPAREPWPAFADRGAAALAELAAGLPTGSTAVVVTSGGVVSAACVALLGLPAAALIRFNRVAVNCAVTKLVHGRAGTTLVSFNDHSHLERSGRSLLSYR